MRNGYVMAALALTALAASSGALRADRGSPVASSCPEVLEARYFPVGTLGPGGDDSFVRRWYSSNLASMEEPSLSCGPLEATEAYRFLWLRSFHDAIAVRISRRGDFYGLEAVILDRAGRFSANYRRWLFGGPGDHRRGNVSRRVTTKLSPDQGQALIARLEGVRFWQLAARGNVLPGTDGARWILEARREGRYHVVDRWSDNDDGIKSLGMFFLDLAGLGDVGPVY